MVEPLSIAIGAGIAIVVLLAFAGIYLAGRRPDHIINMREVSAYYRHKSAAEALRDDIDDSEGDA